MKSVYSRRYRSNAAPSKETAIAKKDNQQEQPFFSPASPQSFFKPSAAIQRKCEKCEADDKNVKRMTEKEEEKPIQKMDEKKEEKPVMKMDEKKEEKPIQKMDEKKEEEKPIQKMDEKKEEKPIQKMEEKKEEERPIQKMEEEKKLDKKETDQSSQVADQTNAYVYSLSGKGNTLPGETQQFFKQRMGYDFSHVKIHTDTTAIQSAKDLNAKAYAVDNNIVFNKGQYDPGSAEGKKLLAHELTHVAQQKGNGPEVLQSAGQLEIHRKEAGAQSVYSAGKATNSRNERAFGCEGVAVEGHTDANYTDTYSSSGTAKPSTKCPDCGEPECIKAKGTIQSVFKANPVVTLPAVPGGLSECETNAVSKFIDTTLSKHEQAHVKAFNSYNATIKTPYKFTGCQADLDAYIQSLHDGINQKRTVAANKKSAKLDPFNRPIPCKCD